MYAVSHKKTEGPVQRKIPEVEYKIVELSGNSDVDNIDLTCSYNTDNKENIDGVLEFDSTAEDDSNRPHEREALKQIEEVRRTFCGEFCRFGAKRGNRSCKTVLLRNVMFAERLRDLDAGAVWNSSRAGMVSDHLWFNLTMQFQASDLRKGDRVLFDARVKQYTKGSIKRGIPISTSYKLSYPTKIRKL